MAIQINTQNFIPSNPTPQGVRSDRPSAYSDKPSTNPAFIISGPAPNGPEVYTPPADPTYDVDALLVMHGQQQNAADYILDALGQAGDLSGLRDPFATVADGEVPSFEDPIGATLNYLIGAHGADGSKGAGDIFNLALSANGQVREAINLPALAAGSASQNLPPNATIAQMVLDVQQANMDTLLSLGGNGSSSDRGLSDLI